MAQAARPLYVFAHLGGDWAPCGRLDMTEEGPALLASNFAYGLQYLKRGDAIEVDPVSLGIADRTAIEGKLLYPVNELPMFGGLRDAAPDAWGRRVIEAKLKVPANSLPESEYLLHAGSNRVGALDVRRNLEDAPQEGPNNWHELAYLMEAAERIEEGAPIPARLEAIFRDGTALGGARPKASIRNEQSVMCLAKFHSRTDTRNVPLIETAILRLAKEAGMEVPPLEYVTFGSRQAMLIRRFDRYWAPRSAKANAHLPDDLMETLPAAGLVEKRLPFVSGLTLLACDELASRTKSYGQLADAIRRYCHPKVIRKDNEELFRRMIYNIFVSNDDDHLKNHGFLWDARLPGWRLSPLYDVLPRPSLAHERQLHLGIGPHGRAATLDNAYAARELFTLSPASAAAEIVHVWEKVREWQVCFEQHGVTAEEITKVAPAIRHIDDVSTAALRRQLP